MTYQWKFSQNDLVCRSNGEVDHTATLTSGMFRV